MSGTEWFCGAQLGGVKLPAEVPAARNSKSMVHAGTGRWRQKNGRPMLIVGSRPDTPQFRGGNPYFFSENPYQSVSFIYASMYRENVHAIHIEMQFAKKSRHCVIKVDSQQQRTKTGALLHVARRSD